MMVHFLIIKKVIVSENRKSMKIVKQNKIIIFNPLTSHTGNILKMSVMHVPIKNIIANMSKVNENDEL